MITHVNKLVLDIFVGSVSDSSMTDPNSIPVGFDVFACCLVPAMHESPTRLK